MSDTVTPLRKGDGVFASYLTEEELAQMNVLLAFPNTSGFIMFDKNAEVIASDNIAEISAAVFANIFDAAWVLGEQMGQTDHRSITFENKQQEIVCHRWSQTNIVFVRSKTSS